MPAARTYYVLAVHGIDRFRPNETHLVPLDAAIVVLVVLGCQLLGLGTHLEPRSTWQQTVTGLDASHIEHISDLVCH